MGWPLHFLIRHFFSSKDSVEAVYIFQVTPISGPFRSSENCQRRSKPQGVTSDSGKRGALSSRQNCHPSDLSCVKRILICVGVEVMPQQSQTSTNDLEALLERTDIQPSLEDQRSMSLTSEVDNDNNKNTGRVRSARLFLPLTSSYLGGPAYSGDWSFPFS